ncbi:unnamed protein product, partial [Closterium sp. Naga37s-1]
MVLLRATAFVLVFAVLTAAFSAVHWPLRRSWIDDLIAPEERDDDPPIAVCLVGSARAFEATGPSLPRHLLLPSAHPSPQHLSHRSHLPHLSHRPLHLFLHEPLDETSAKLSFLRSFVRSTSSGSWGSTISWGSGISWNSGLKRKARGNDVAARDWSQLARENAIAAVRVFPNNDVDETKYPTGVMFTGDSPSGLQGLLQYFRLVEGCWDMIQSFEATSAPPLRYNWIVRARLDSLWTAPAPIQPPPPILPPSVPAIATTAAAPAGAAAAVAAAAIVDDIGVGDNLAYTIPYGSDWWGLNDRFGMGGRQASEAALKRLSALQLLARRKMRNLNSEGAFKAQLSLGGIKVQRASLPFCVLSQRTYTDGCAPTVYSLNSSVPLNGAKCRPCSRPCATGEKARALVSRIAPSEPNWPGPAAGEGEVGVCDAARGWEKGWEAEFDAVMGEDMAEGRRQVVQEAMGSIDECEQAWDEFHALTVSWDAPSPRAVCVRARMGPSAWVGGGPRGDGRFATFLSLLSASSNVVVVVEGGQDSSMLQTNQQPLEGDETRGSAGVKRRLLGHLRHLRRLLAPDTVAPGNLSPDTVAPGNVSPDTVAPGNVSPGTVATGSVTPGVVAPGTVAPDTVAAGASVSPGPDTVAPIVDVGVFSAWKKDLGRRIKGISISHRTLAWLQGEAAKEEDAPIDVLL